MYLALEISVGLHSALRQ